MLWRSKRASETRSRFPSFSLHCVLFLHPPGPDSPRLNTAAAAKIHNLLIEAAAAVCARARAENEAAAAAGARLLCIKNE